MDFKSYVEKLSDENRLVKITKPVSIRYEIAALMKKLDGKPVLFDNVEGHEMKVVGNVLSSMDLLTQSIGIKKEDWISTMIRAIENPGEVVISSSNRFTYLEPDLDVLPILTHYLKDPAPYITSDVILAQFGNRRNASVHRLQKLGKDRMVGRIVEGRDLHSMYMAAKEQNEELPIAITIGNKPSVLIAGSTTVSRDLYELGIASALEGKPIEVVKGKTNDIEYPIDTEIVLEGRIQPNETVKEGPFLDLTETYDVVREQPIIVIDAIAVQKNPIYQALLPGGNEHKLLMGQPRTPTVYKSLKDKNVDVKNIFLTPGGSGWLEIVVSIDKKSENDVTNAIDAIINGHKSVKMVTIVDSDFDVTNPEEVAYAKTMYWKAGKQHVFENVKGSSLDPMASPDGIGDKLIIDATRPLQVSEERKGKMERVRSHFEVDLEKYM